MSGRLGASRKFRWIGWSIVALAALFCFYRRAVFIPQPLDSPGTLRPILYRGFSWFLGFYETRDAAFDAWFAICLVALLLPVALASLFYGVEQGFVKLPRRAAQILGSRALFFASLAAALLLCRYPTLLENELNPDEGQLIAAADKLFYDPSFFRAVDSGTSGPINVYPLMLPAILGFTPDFASSRAIVLTIIFLSALLLYGTIRMIAPEGLARIAVLPFIGAFAVFKDTELVYYSSEHISLLLISLALYWSVRVLRRPASYRAAIFTLGVILSAAFFAKMQSAPIVAVLAAVAVAFVHATGHADKWWRPAVLIVAGVMPFILINAAICAATGAAGDFWLDYISANISYSATDTQFVTDLQRFTEFLLTSAKEVRFFLFMMIAAGSAYMVERMRRRLTSEQGTFLQLAVVGAAIATAIVLPPGDRWETYGFVALLALCLVPIYFAVLFCTGSIGDDPVRWFGFLAFVSIGAALFSIFKPHHAFTHYLLFLFVPLSAGLAWMLSSQRIAFVALTIGLSVAYQYYLWGFQDDHVFRNVATAIRAPEGDYIRSLTSPRGRIFVWGWTSQPYLSSGRVLATRDTNVANCFRSYNLMTLPPVIVPTPEAKDVEAYYVDRVLHDLRSNPPELFIDAIGPSSWFLVDRKYYGFEQFHDIAVFVHANYEFLKEDWGQRFFLRKDLLIK